MTKTLIDIDDELLARAMTATNSNAKKEAVNRAPALSVESDSQRRLDAQQADLLEACPWVEVPGPTWDYVRAMGSGLAKHSMHDMFSVAGYPVAAVAIEMKLVVLHLDDDFVAAARVFPQLEQERVVELPD